MDELIDLIFNRYNYSDIVGMDPLHATDLFIKAISKREEEKAWQMWLFKYQHMEKDNFIPFSEFYKSHTDTDIPEEKPEKEILQEVQKIRTERKKAKECS